MEGYQALYREWRPKSFEDVIGQEHITTTLRNQIRSGNIAHAYLFCGTRGTGKTSSAKVFAKAINCLNLKDGEPCDECESCIKFNRGTAIDIIELDAASNNGVSNIRDIIDEAKYSPQESRYKIYIMDEVHMLSSGAVNAFLKTLEEPPKNVVFILATTDPQKLPVTILSRCQRFDFRRIDKAEIVNRLRKIATEKNYIVEDNSLSLIAKVSDGAMRDALSILDQAVSMGNGNVEYNSLVGMLGLVADENLHRLTDAFISKKIDESLRIINEVVMSGKDINLFIKEMIGHYRNLLVVQATNSAEDILDMSEDNIIAVKEQSKKTSKDEILRCIRILQEVEQQSKFSNQGRLFLELAVVKICKIQYDSSPEIMDVRMKNLEQMMRNGGISAKAISSDKNNVSTGAERTENINLTEDIVKRFWNKILLDLKSKKKMIVMASLSYGIVEKVVGNKIYITFDDKYKFNVERLNTVENLKVINESFSAVLGMTVSVIVK